VITPVVLPWPLHSSLEAATRALFDPGDRPTTERLLVSIGARKSELSEEWTLNPL
jgi:hypothetical protein